VPPFNSLGMVSYLTSVATIAISCTVSKIHQLSGQKSLNFLTPLYSASLLGVKPSELSNDPQLQKTRMMGLSGCKRISMKRLAVLIQSMRVTHRNAKAYTRAKFHLLTKLIVNLVA